MQYVVLDDLNTIKDFILYTTESKELINKIKTTEGLILKTSKYNALIPKNLEYLAEKYLSNKKKDYRILTTETELSQLEEYLQEKEHISYDIETTGLKFLLDSVIGISICAEENLAFYIPHLTWVDGSLHGVICHDRLKRIIQLLVGKKLLMWNGSFDIRFTKQFFGVDLTESLYVDVMLLKHTIAEEGVFSLKDCAILYQEELGLNMEEQANKEQIALKQNVAKNGGSTTKTNYEMYKADLEVMGEYAAADADLTYRLYILLNAKLHKENLNQFFYVDEVMPLYKNVTIVMESMPVKLDLSLIHKTRDEIELDMAKIKQDILDDIKSYPEFDDYFRDLVEKQISVSTRGFFAECVLNYYGVPTELGKSGNVSITKKFVSSIENETVKGFLKGEQDLDPDVIYNIRKMVWESKNGEPINISSKTQMGNFCFNFLGIKPLSKTDKGNPQFDDDFIQSISKEMKWAELLGDYNKLGKIKSTYIERFLDNQVDGNYYFYYKQHGTLSGRFSSDAQQLPRPKEEGELSEKVLHYNNLVRSFFIAGEGRKFIDADYESLEPHCFSEVAGDEKLKDIFRNGHDFYSTIAIQTEKLFEYSADKKDENYLGKKNKPKRQFAKTYSLGIPYGQTPYALALSLNVSQEEAQKLYDGYLDGFVDLKNWMESSKRQVQRTGQVSTSTGRVRHLPKVKEIFSKYGDSLLDFKYRKSLTFKLKGKMPDPDSYVKGLYLDYKNGVNNSRNFQIQGLAASVVNRAMIAIMDQFKLQNIDGWVCATIHDQIICNVNESHLDKAKKIVKDCMENTTKLSIELKAPPAIGNNWKDSH